MSTATDRQVEVKRNRYGYKVDGEFRRRVTTHLRGIPKPWLGGWAAKEVASFAVEHTDQWLPLVEAGKTTDAMKLLKGAPWSKRDDAADRGSAVHSAIEAFLNDTPLPDGLNEEEETCALSAMEFLDEFLAEPLAAELTVFSRQHDYAGTLDLWCVDREGTRWIVDFKTSSDVYPEHAVQQVAYQRAEWAVIEKASIGKEDEERWSGRLIQWGPERAEKLGILHVTPDGAKLHEIEQGVTERLWTVFRAAKVLKAFQADTDSYRSEPDVRVYRDPVSYGPEPETTETVAA